MSTFRCVVFTLSNHKFALPLNCVERVVRAVEVTPLPDAPATIAGVINVRGQLVPVIDMRSRLQASASLPNHSATAQNGTTELDLNDQLIIARNGENLVAIVAHAVEEVAEFNSNDIVPSETLPGTDVADEHLHGVIATGDDIILVRHPSHFLASHSLLAGEPASLAAALESRKVL